MSLTSSAPTPTELTFAWGTIDEANALGFEELLHRNWEEIGEHQERLPLDIDWRGYRALERDGVTRLGMLRRDGRLIGYNVFFVSPSLHYRHSRWATNDLIWLTPPERRGLTGARMIRDAERLLRQEGVQRVFYVIRTPLELGDNRDRVAKLLQRLGYVRAEERWGKFIHG